MNVIIKNNNQDTVFCHSVMLLFYMEYFKYIPQLFGLSHSFHEETSIQAHCASSSRPLVLGCKHRYIYNLIIYQTLVERLCSLFAIQVVMLMCNLVKVGRIELTSAFFLRK